jgi:hypothetical protein
MIDKSKGRIEKYILRKAFDVEEDPYLPKEVGGGVGGSTYSACALVTALPMVVHGHQCSGVPAVLAEAFGEGVHLVGLPVLHNRAQLAEKVKWAWAVKPSLPCRRFQC